MELAEAIDYIRPNKNGVLVTYRRDGRAQLSNITYLVDDDDTVAISVTADRAKSRNVTRDPLVELHVTASDFWSYAVLEGTAAITPAAADPNDATVEQLVLLYQRLVGEHPDWAEYRAAMVRDRRQVLRISPSRAYGMLARP